MLLKLTREGLGRLIVFGDWVSRPRPVKRSARAQESVNEAAAALSLYQFHACPFCVKVRRNIHKLNIPIELRDAQGDTPFRQELEAQGGRVKVPCLRIEEEGEVRWLYESDDINVYLHQRFSGI
ncbi:glutaredoxin family protein [Marinagarivorans algicola]|uniref:glutaredoxin family protein n=1 Tax=Marinagarivorans algicola TaxID=1513270 RepID=UPI0006B4E408|nr:glutathione S-transferase N-terminal domain-containing protein [Marinagarivorans algicola]